MNKEGLIESASKLKRANTNTVEEYTDKSDMLVAKLNAAMLSLIDINEIVGYDNIGMMKNNHTNHVRFMAAIVEKNNPEVLVDTILWVFNTYINHGFQPKYWEVQLKCWKTILKEELTPVSYKEIIPFYEWIFNNINTIVELSSKIQNSNFPD